MPASQPHDSRYSPYIEETVVTGTAVTATQNSGALSGYGPVKTIRAQLNVTAATGTTPTLDVLVQDSLDGTNWNTIGTFAQKTAAAREVINITTPFADRVRVLQTVGGTTPSFTYTVIFGTETDPT